MKKARTKLTLNRETLATLSDDRLNGAAGGGPLPTSAPSDCGSCVSVCICATQFTGCCHTQTDCVESYRAC